MRWTDRQEQEYQEKLAAMEKSLPPMPEFDPAIWRQREEIRSRFARSLSPAEQLRHGCEREAIIV